VFVCRYVASHAHPFFIQLAYFLAIAVLGSVLSPLDVAETEQPCLQPSIYRYAVPVNLCIDLYWPQYRDNGGPLEFSDRGPDYAHACRG
jgi:hypothetical protein